jgi:hypothetical protein
MDDLFGQLKSALISPKWDSWQTLILISIFSWAVSLLTILEGFQRLIVWIAWVFLIPGIHWFLHEEKFKLQKDLEINIKKSLTFNKLFIGPWITGALVCLFLFRSVIDIPVSALLILWPTISVLISALPKFVAGVGPKYSLPEKPEVRQQLINLLLSNLLISCWFQLHFLTQQWLAQYPSVLTENLNRSSFVVQLSPVDRPRPRGYTILEQASALLEADLEGQSWSQVEQWLLNQEDQIAALQPRTLEQANRIKEDEFWKLQGLMLPGEYNLELAIVWLGPTRDGIPYHFKRTCQINQVSNAQAIRTTPGGSIVQVQCGPISQRLPGVPEPDTQ